MTDSSQHASSLRQRTITQLADKSLRQNLQQVTDRLAEAQVTAFDQLSSPDELRERAKINRGRTLERLPELLAEFADQLLASGAHVHWAADGKSARRYIGEIAHQHKVRKVVKSKSMACEEIGLNTYLKDQGVEVIETDLGEWVIQKAGEMPSHIIVPAIHKNREQIAKALGQDTTKSPSELAAYARSTLRGEFLTADMGISGVNFGIASSGSLILVTNEGNGRLVTSIPRIHIAVMGMERLVSDFADLDLMLALLPRSATGQALTAYTSVITGPRGDKELDGPDELHVVILDNGRTSILGTEFQEILHCIRCGACLNVCPVYRQIGGHGYNSVYSGPIGSVLSPLLEQSGEKHELAQASTLCGACWKVCPVGIPIQRLLLSLRSRASKNRRSTAAWRLWALAWSRPRVFRASLCLFRILAKCGRALGLGFMPIASKWSKGRTIPRASQVSEKDVGES